MTTASIPALARCRDSVVGHPSAFLRFPVTTPVPGAAGRYCMPRRNCLVERPQPPDRLSSAAGFPPLPGPARTVGEVRRRRPGAQPPPSPGRVSRNSRRDLTPCLDIAAGTFDKQGRHRASFMQ